MIVVFFQHSYYIWYRIGNYHPDGLPGCYIKPEFTMEYEKQIISILKDKFESIVFSPEVPNDFKFEDNADEAAFLLWSSDGIEI